MNQHQLSNDELSKMCAYLQLLPLLLIVNAIDFTTALVEVFIVFYTTIQKELTCVTSSTSRVNLILATLTLQLRVALHELIENVKTALGFTTENNTTLFQEIPINVGS